MVIAENEAINFEAIYDDLLNNQPHLAIAYMKCVWKKSGFELLKRDLKTYLLMRW